MQFEQYSNLHYLGKLAVKSSGEFRSSHFGIGFECLDRDMWNPENAWKHVAGLGVKWARVQTGWAKTETVKGIYHFEWLDEIVDTLAARGLKTWLSLSYGNPLYTGEMNTAVTGEPEKPVPCNYAGVGFPPIHTPEEREGWRRYVRALVAHFKDRVDHYEIWNEPDLLSFWKCQPKPAEYTEFVKITAESIRAIQPEAKIIGGSIAWGMTAWSLAWLEDCFKCGMHESIDILTYHGYKSVPERHSTQEIAAFKHLLKKYKPSLEYWMGEGGVQSYVPPAGVGKGALSGMKASEAIQSRMLLRRLLLELANGAAMNNYFHMSDFEHYGKGCNVTFHYGVIDLQGKPKPAYYALQTLANVLCDPVEPADGRTSCHISVLKDTEDPRATKAHVWNANFVKGKIPVHSWWIPESVEDDPVVKDAELNFWMDSSLYLKDPVMIDPVTQEVYAVDCKIDRRSCGESWMVDNPENQGIRVFAPMPISNTPLLLTDRSLIELRPDGE